MVLDGLLRLTEVRIGVAQVAQEIPFALPVTGLARDLQGLPVLLDGLVHLSEGRMGQAQAVQELGLCIFVSRFLRAVNAFLQPAFPLLPETPQIQVLLYGPDEANQKGPPSVVLPQASIVECRSQVGPLEVKEGEGREDIVAAFSVEAARLAGDLLVVAGQAEVGGLGFLSAQGPQVVRSSKTDQVVLVVAGRAGVVGDEATVAEGLQSGSGPLLRLGPEGSGSGEVEGGREEGEEGPGAAGIIVQLIDAEGDGSGDVEVGVAGVAELGQAGALVGKHLCVLVRRDVVVEVEVVAGDTQGKGQGAAQLGDGVGLPVL